MIDETLTKQIIKQIRDKEYAVLQDNEIELLKKQNDKMRTFLEELIERRIYSLEGEDETFRIELFLKHYKEDACSK